jgi:2'-5' RNA ligase
VRLFVAVWPDQRAVAALAAIEPDRPSAGLRWVPAQNWHVTLAFLGSVPDHRCEDVAAALRSVGPSAVPTATLGPTTRLLGRGVLCIPVAGLGELASAVRAVTDPFLPEERREDRPFVGHLTLARAARGRSIHRRAAGVAISVAWPVRDIRLMVSTSTAGGSRYDPKEIVPLGR